MAGNDLAGTGPAPAAGEGPPGLYIHLPYCRSKCPYCAFPSTACGAGPPAAYLDAVLAQAGTMAGLAWSRERLLDSLFIGGGTPTIYAPEALAGLVDACLALFRFGPAPEITVEANPNTVTFQKLRRLRMAGVNRLSIGVQSFTDRLLQAIGRTHSAAGAEEAVRLARRAGFDNLNLDLIYGLPGQTMADWRQSVEQALSYEPEHLALYELMIEAGTPFSVRLRAGTLPLPPEGLVVEMERYAWARLAESGYQRYEISNFCRPGHECRHNLKYWHNLSYVGLGAGAVSCLSGLRIRNVADPDRYMELAGAGRPVFQEAECLDRAARFRETVVMGLRLLGGVRLASLAERFGLTPERYYGTTIENLIGQGLVEISDGHLRLTVRGLPVANRVLAELV